MIEKSTSTWLAISAMLAAGTVASADVVRLELRGADGGRSAGVSLTMDDAAGTMTVRIQNMTQGDGQSARNISAFFWSFTGMGLGGQTNLGAAGTSSLRPWAETGTPVSPAQYWGLRDLSGLPSGATQALGLRTLALGGPGGSVSPDSSSSTSPDGMTRGANTFGRGARSQSDGTLLSATGSQVPGGRNQFRDYVEFTYTDLAAFYASYHGARNVSIGHASAQFGSTLGDPNVALLLVPLPPAATAGITVLAGLAGVRALRRRVAAR